MATDLYNDPGHSKLARLMEEHPRAKEFLKNAQFEEARNLIPKTAFAWQNEKLFPLHTPEHALVSYLYSKEASEVPNAVKKEIEDALMVYGIKTADFKMEKVAEAPNPDDFLFPEKLAYPVRTIDEIKLAEEKVLSQITKLKPETKVAVFTKLLKAAERLNYTPKTASFKYAGKTATAKSKLIESLESRQILAKTAEDRTLMGNYISAIKTEKNFNGLQAKLAVFIEAYDKRNNLEQFYNKKLPDPVDTVFNTTKLASDNYIAYNGQKAYYSDIAKLPLSFFKDVLGDDFANELANGTSVDPGKLGIVMPTLPSDLKGILFNALKSTGMVNNE